MANLATQAFGFRAGYPQKTAVDIVVCSKSNAAMTVTLNGVTENASWTATNTDIGNGVDC